MVWDEDTADKKKTISHLLDDLSHFIKSDTALKKRVSKLEKDKKAAETHTDARQNEITKLTEQLQTTQAQAADAGLGKKLYEATKEVAALSAAGNWFMLGGAVKALEKAWEEKEREAAATHATAQ